MSFRPYIHIAAVHLSDLRRDLVRLKVEHADEFIAKELQKALDRIADVQDALDKDNSMKKTINSRSINEVQ